MPLTRIKTKGLGTSVTFENITDTGTEGTKVATGTTAQRGSTTGQWRYNTTTGFFEGRNTTGTFSTLEPTPIVTSVDDTEVDDDVAFYVIIGVSESNDLNYSGIDPEDILFINQNNDQEIIGDIANYNFSGNSNKVNILYFRNKRK